MSTKYNWALVPDWVEYITTDANGKVRGWDSKPNINVKKWFAIKHISLSISLDIYPYLGEWTRSLEKRPAGVPPVCHDFDTEMAA